MCFCSSETELTRREIHQLPKRTEIEVENEISQVKYSKQDLNETKEERKQRKYRYLYQVNEWCSQRKISTFNKNYNIFCLNISAMIFSTQVRMCHGDVISQVNKIYGTDEKKKLIFTSTVMFTGQPTDIREVRATSWRECVPLNCYTSTVAPVLLTSSPSSISRHHELR